MVAPTSPSEISRTGRVWRERFGSLFSSAARRFCMTPYRVPPYPFTLTILYASTLHTRIT